MRPLADASPRFKARLAGTCEALEGFTSAAGQVLILDRLIVTGNASATAANILGHERLFVLGFALSLIAVPLHIAWALLFYDLFKPVSKAMSSFATFVILVGCAIQAVTCLLYFAPLLILKGGTAVSAFTPQQVQDLAYLFLKLNGHAFNVYLVFFGLWCSLTGYLILRSTFLPRFLGAALTLNGVGWMTFLVPSFASSIFPIIAGISALAEIPLQLWLLIAGVNDKRWREQAAAADRDRAPASG